MRLYIMRNWQSEVEVGISRANQSTYFIQKYWPSLKIVKNENGKPYILHSHESINWSHNEDTIVVAFSNRGEVGVDIERIHLLYVEQLHSWVLHQAEKEKIAQGTSFAEVWTRKEALLKCIGKGIYDEMYRWSSYKVDDFTIQTLYLHECCISVCSQVEESLKIYDLNEMKKDFNIYT